MNYIIKNVWSWLLIVVMKVNLFFICYLLFLFLSFPVFQKSTCHWVKADTQSQGKYWPILHIKHRIYCPMCTQQMINEMTWQYQCLYSKCNLETQLWSHISYLFLSLCNMLSLYLFYFLFDLVTLFQIQSEINILPVSFSKETTGEK